MDLNKVIGGMSEVEQLKDQLAKNREHNKTLSQMMFEQHKEIEELKQKILVLETMLKFNQTTIILN